MRIRTIIISVFAVSLLVSPAWCEMGKKAQWMSDLGLTQEQQSKLVKIHNDKKEIRGKYRDSIASVHKKIKNELGQPNPSKQALDEYAVALGKLHSEQIQNNNDQMLKIKEILTPEQFSKMMDKGWKGQGKVMHGKHKGKRGPGAGHDCADKNAHYGAVK